MIVVKKLNDNMLLIILDGNREIYVRGNYGEGCAASFKSEDGEQTKEFESQGDKEKVIWEL